MTARDELPLTPRTEPLQLDRELVPHPRPYLIDVRVDAGAVGNVVGHVANTEYVHWLDRAAELHADTLGCTRARLLDDGVMWFVARHEIDYCAEAHLDDDLVIATWVRDMHRVRSWRDYVITRPADGATIVKAATLWVLVDLETRRPRRIPADIRAPFEPLEGAPPCTSA